MRQLIVWITLVLQAHYLLAMDSPATNLAFWRTINGLLNEKDTSIHSAPALMPMPASVQYLGQRFTIQSSFSFAIEGPAHDRLYRAATRFNQRLAERTGIFMKTWIVDRGNESLHPSLRIRCQRPGVVGPDMDETYRLSVTEKEIIIDAATDIGAIRGLETLFQLIASDDRGFYFTGAKIEDKPRFSWRGLLISQPYHFMPMEVIRHTLDAMCLVKMNVLHFYISDDQAFTVESKRYPRLHQEASAGQYFTQEQIREIIAYADDRGIRVVPEVDLPGHSTAILTVFPHLASLPRDYVLQDHWGVFDPVMDPTKESTYTFLDTLLTEMASLFPDPYFHIGGDENTGRDWAKNDSIRRFMKANGLQSTVALQNHFNRRVQQILRKSGKTAVAWDEIIMREISDKVARSAFDNGDYAQLILQDVPKDIVIQSWRGMEALLASAKNGYRSLLSKGYYIDLVQPTWYHYLNDPVPARNTLILPDSEANYDRFESRIMERVKRGDTLLTAAEEKFIIGGEATMWTEHVTAETMDSRIWPRTAAIAERFWSAATVRDVQDMYRRMDAISIQLEWVGSSHIRNREMMLRRLTGTEDVRPLLEVVDLLEPVKGYRRNAKDNFTKYAPYTQLVDIAIPDSRSLRTFRQLAGMPLIPGEARSAPDLSGLEKMLKRWRANHLEVVKLAQGQPLLGTLLVHAAILDQLAEGFLQKWSKEAGGGVWGAAERRVLEQLLDKAAAPQGYCELMVVDALRRLL